MMQIVLPLEPDDSPRRESTRPAPDAPIDFVRHPRARRYVVRVRADGSVRVTIPRRGSKREAEAFAREQREWIRKQVARVAEERRAAAAPLRPGEVRELRSLAERTLPQRLFELAARHELTVAAVRVRDQRWRWGSCSPGGRISLNWRLVRMPEWVRDYVIIHELMHLRRMDHSRAFWAHVAAACPRYQEARRWLRQHQAAFA